MPITSSSTRKRRSAAAIARDCEWLDMGGLYRAASLRARSGTSPTAICTPEEMELGLRLGERGWTLASLGGSWRAAPWTSGRQLALLAGRWRSAILTGPESCCERPSGAATSFVPVQRNAIRFSAYLSGWG